MYQPLPTSKLLNHGGNHPKSPQSTEQTLYNTFRIPSGKAMALHRLHPEQAGSECIRHVEHAKSSTLKATVIFYVLKKSSNYINVITVYPQLQRGGATPKKHTSKKRQGKHQLPVGGCLLVQS